MTPDEQTSQELLPYVKPAVERIPLSDARGNPTGNPLDFDGNTSSS
jgi:hypothetical protein